MAASPRRAVLWAALLSGAAAGCSGPPVLDRPLAWTFEDDVVGRPAAGWVVPRVRHEGTEVPAGYWVIGRDPRAPSPAQLLRQRTTHFEGGHANLVVADTDPVRDFRLRVQVRAFPGARAARVMAEYAARGLEVPADVQLGAQQRGGGPVFRYTDPDNYYVMRWNPLQSVVRLGIVRHGRRSTLASAPVNTAGDDAAWHQLEVACRGPRIVGAFDGVQVIEHEDWAHDAGRIGLSTSADASAGFDDVWLEPLGPPGPAGPK
jgi:hypothetical protein